MTHRGHSITSPTDCDPADLAICADCHAYFDGGNGGDCPDCDAPGGSMWAHPEASA